MNLSKISRDQLARPAHRERDAATAFRESRLPDALRHGREALELGLKARLRALGIEVPKRHEVGPDLDEVTRVVPEWLGNDIPSIQKLSFEFAERRSLAMCGEERTGQSARDLFDDARDVEGYLRDVERALRRVRRFLSPSPPPRRLASRRGSDSARRGGSR
ncbi:MAG: HEPN domain-containing protein [Thermoplasmata archaeon]